MPINDEEIRLSPRLPRETYIRMRDICYRKEETHQEFVLRAIEREVKRHESSRQDQQPSRRSGVNT